MAKVIIVGCGVGGPALAIFLKRLGFEPTIYERTKGFADAGLSLLCVRANDSLPNPHLTLSPLSHAKSLQPNGLKVLSLLPGLFDSIPGKDIDSMSSYSTLGVDEGILGDNDVPANIRQVFGYPMRGVRRTELIKLLVDTAEAQGIPILWDHRLTDIEQTDVGVRAIFANGFIDTGTFLVGCDGLHSATRKVLFGEEPTTFLGLTQVRRSRSSFRCKQ
jgi:salicylate hydroxylase